MIYREHAFTLVETLNPSSWKWTVQLTGNGSKTGDSPKRHTAVLAAWSAIDQVFKSANRAETVTHTIVDGRMIPKPAI
jgi:hypothetical protein